jgi:hypothetical protein
MALLRHELGNRKTNTYAIAVQCRERLAKTLHGGRVVTDGT